MGPLTLEGFVQKWLPSGASERANKDAFLLDLCTFLAVPAPDPKTDNPDRDVYVFEKDVRIQHEDRHATLFIDLYKQGCFILEAKQGSGQDSKKVGTAKRETPSWYTAMHDAKGQAIQYASTFDDPPPFIVVTDVGYCFDLYANFGGSYTAFPNAQTNRIYLSKMGKDEVQTLRAIFTEPRGLDPSLRAAKVTQEVAGHLARLARSLEETCDDPELIARFLMRCIFTMFAEDIGLLPKDCFTDALHKRWIPKPMLFQHGIEALWQRMNEGGDDFGLGTKILKFNGGLFADPKSLPMSKQQLQVLHLAALSDWSEVEPAIFGTLLERALDRKKRHAIGAHFTPRAYVERLVKPTIEEPLRADWDAVRVEVRQLVEKGDTKKAREKVRDFHAKLCATRVLDPACGSGNFLYVALDLFKRLEAEILGLLSELGEGQTLLDMTGILVTPAQFLGIEKERWAKEIAELVLWIGYLQWHYRNEGKRGVPIAEPVLRDYANIECRDAILAYDAVEPVVDEQGRPVTRWDGETMKRSPVTGEPIPDLDAQVPSYRYRNPRKARWPDADFVIGNPPFVGNKKMRLTLGDSYVAALREVWGDVPESVDYVMYWWKHASNATSSSARRAGLITTKSITQDYNRSVVADFLSSGHLAFAIPNHPWVDSADGADVRIAMTAMEAGQGEGLIQEVISEELREGGGGELAVGFATRRGRIHPDLRTGADAAIPSDLLANAGLSFMGVTLSGQGFVVERDDPLVRQEPRALKRYVVGNELNRVLRGRYVIDFFGLEEDSARASFPQSFQRVIDRVKPEREQQNRESYRRSWWLFAEPRQGMRAALRGLVRYVGICRTAKHFIFQFLTTDVLPESKVIAISVEDPWILGILSSRLHVAWAVRRGSRHGVGNDLTYNNSACFGTFPFPRLDEHAAPRIRRLAEAIDAHRKDRQQQHHDLMLTKVYNVLEKLRSGAELSAKERVIHEQGLVSVLRKLHDDLDAAVFDAYGWPHDLTDEQILERLVALNAERAEEERRGLIRWLRPEFQNPSGKVQIQGKMTIDAQPPTPAKLVDRSWPKKLPEQIAAVRDLLAGTAVGAWSAEQVAAAFKGARPKQVMPVLEGLAALGILLSYEVNGTRRWRLARAVVGGRQRPSAPPPATNGPDQKPDSAKPKDDLPLAVDRDKLRKLRDFLVAPSPDDDPKKSPVFKEGEGVEWPVKD